ncbi:hypothetical protein SORBI_3007G022800 [Sorghum bicolor]|uniref:Uncharacterized protein n=1 Tax=Sorghum bicolor TaxID=4558 RepID=A0A1B6PF21_SORBI|nr:hypothetical protein SORBI_3007G022800 [Sorghum bicolor]
MAITVGLGHSTLPLARTRRGAPPHDPCSLLTGEPCRIRPCRANLAMPPVPLDDDEPRKSPLDVALLLASIAAAAAAASPHAALAASGGAMGGRSYSSSSRPSSSSPASSSSSSSSSWSSPSSSSTSEWPSSSSSTSSSSTSWPSSSISSSPEQQTEATHVSVGTAQPPPVVTAAERDAATLFWTRLASASVSAVALLLAVRHYTRPKTTVIKLQVALLGLAKSFQKDLNEIAEKVEASNQRWYKFILTETICSLRRHNNCCISSCLSVDVKDSVDSWEQHFDKISIEERSKFDEETLYNLEGIKRKKTYSRKPDGFRNEYIVGIQVLWTPQDENDVLSEEKLLGDYPYLKPLCED